jgi:hypothetical protein
MLNVGSYQRFSPHSLRIHRSRFLLTQVVNRRSTRRPFSRVDSPFAASLMFADAISVAIKALLYMKECQLRGRHFGNPDWLQWADCAFERPVAETIAGGGTSWADTGPTRQGAVRGIKSR